MGFLAQSLANFRRGDKRQTFGLKVLCCAAIVLWLVHTLINFQHKIPQGDEVGVLLSDEALYRTGNASYSSDSLGGSYGGNPHPPLRWLLVQAIMHLGLSAFQSSLVLNLLCGICIIVATWWLGYHLARHESVKSPARLGAFSVVLLCFTPLFQAGMGIIDIDNGVLTAVMSLYLVMLLGIYDRVSSMKLVVLGLVFGIVLLTKMSTPLILIPFTLTFFWIKQGSIRNALEATGTVMLIAFFVFAVIFGVTIPLFGEPWYEPFLNNYSLLLAKWQPHSWKGGFLRTIGELSLWIGPPAGIFVVLAMKSFCWPFQQGRIRPVAALLVAYVVCIWLVYAYLGVTFNLRYMIPSLPAFAAVTALLVSQLGIPVIGSDGALRFKVVTVVLAMFLLSVLLLPDPILYIKTTVKFSPWRGALSYSVSLIILAVATYVILRWFWKVAVLRGNLFLTWLVCLWLVFNVNTSIKQIAGNYQLGYGYGISEHDDVVRWLRQNAQNAVPVAAPEAFLWSFRGSGFAVYKDTHLLKLMSTYKGKQKSYIYLVLERRNPLWTRDGSAEIMLGTEEVYRNKDFVILKKTFREAIGMEQTGEG